MNCIILIERREQAKERAVHNMTTWLLIAREKKNVILVQFVFTSDDAAAALYSSAIVQWRTLGAKNACSQS